MTRHHRDALPIFLDAVRKLPPVIECHTLMGDVDFLLKIVVPSVQDYEYFVWNKLSQLDGVQGISSSISMSQSINTTRLPIRAATSRCSFAACIHRARQSVVLGKSVSVRVDLGGSRLFTTTNL